MLEYKSVFDWQSVTMKQIMLENGPITETPRTKRQITNDIFGTIQISHIPRLFSALS